MITTTIDTRHGTFTIATPETEDATTPTTRTYFAVGNVGAHDGHITYRDGDDWTYQEVIGAHGTVIKESADRSVCEAALDKFLGCDSVDRGHVLLHAQSERPMSAPTITPTTDYAGRRACGVQS